MSLRTYFPVLIPHYHHSVKDAGTRAQLPRDVLKYSQGLSGGTDLHVSHQVVVMSKISLVFAANAQDKTGMFLVMVWCVSAYPPKSRCLGW